MLLGFFWFHKSAFVLYAISIPICAFVEHLWFSKKTFRLYRVELSHLDFFSLWLHYRLLNQCLEELEYKEKEIIGIKLFVVLKRKFCIL